MTIILQSNDTELCTQFTKAADLYFELPEVVWGISNFRDDDLKDGYNNGDTIPSLISESVTQLSMTDTPLVEEVAEETNLPITAVADMHRKYWFWYLFELQKANRMADFWEKINAYTNNYRLYTATKWHSRYIEAFHKKGRRYACTPFLKYDVRLQRCWILCWRLDLKKVKMGTSSNRLQYSSPKCFELIKTHYKFQSNTNHPKPYLMFMTR